MVTSLHAALASFVSENAFRGQGALSVALIVTDHARRLGLPLDPNGLVTEGGGQVLGLGKAKVQAILKKYDIDRVLAAEGGRTSRGSLGRMKSYVDFLNAQTAQASFDIDAVERFWIERVNDFFAGKPFKIRIDPAKGLRALVRDIILQAEERRKSAPGTQYTGAVLQHLVGAKLDCALGTGKIQHNSYSTSDAQSGRAGDFLLGDTAIHVTTTPSEALIQRCQQNLGEGLRPVIVTLAKGAIVAETLAENLGLGERVDVFEAEQFIALNLYEIGGFATEGGRVAVLDLVQRYNVIIQDNETDPSLMIELAARK